MSGKPHMMAISKMSSTYSDVLSRARSDDQRNNQGWMFGRSTVEGFTTFGRYPESWKVVGLRGKGGYLKRTPTDPCQQVSYYLYEPSAEFGGTGSRPKFTPCNAEDVGKTVTDD